MYRLAAALALMALAFSTRSTADPAKRYTLKELIALARIRAPNVAVAEAQKQVFVVTEREADWLYAPTGDASYAITVAPRVECEDLNGNRSQLNCVHTNLTLLNPSSVAGPGMQFAVNLTIPIYTFGRIEHARAAARHGVAAGEAGIEAAQREAELAVTRVYWGIKAARAARETIQSGRDELSPWEEKVKEDLDTDHPKYTLSDYKRLQIAMSGINVAITDLERRERQAVAGLRGIINESVELDEQEIDTEEIVEHPLDYYLMEAMLHRPEVRQLDEGVAGLRSLSREKLSELLPNIAVPFNFTYRYAPTVDDPQNAFLNHANGVGFSFYLALQQPLDIAQRLTHWQHARADVGVLEAQRQLALAGIRFEIERAHSDLYEARRRVVFADEGQRKARGWLTAVRDDLTAAPRDVVEAARSYFELRIGYLQAIMDANVATAQLRRAAGVDVAR